MFSADFEAWIAGDETEQTNKILSNCIKYAGNHADELLKTIFDDAPVIYKEVLKRKSDASMSEIISQLEIDSMTYFVDEDYVAVLFSNATFLFGHYIECQFRCEWEYLGAYIC